MSWKAKCGVQPIVFVKDNRLACSKGRVQQGQTVCNRIWAMTGLQFVFEPIRLWHTGELFGILPTGDPKPAQILADDARKRLEQESVLTIFFPQYIRLTKKEYWGYSTAAGAVVATKWPWMGRNLAHELGHTFSLSHCHEDDFDDTPNKPSRWSANIMNYGVGFACGVGCFFPGAHRRAFSPQQISHIRERATSGVPAKAVTML